MGKDKTFIVTLTQTEFVHPVICEFAQYNVVMEGANIGNEFPVPINAELHPPVNHPIVDPVPPETLRLMFPEYPEHMDEMSLIA